MIWSKFSHQGPERNYLPDQGPVSQDRCPQVTKCWVEGAIGRLETEEDVRNVGLKILGKYRGAKIRTKKLHK